jgi:transcriptional regulator with PAS, ATPase and Fis domain
MIAWKEIKHIHVIRRIEEILGSWFQVEVYYTDNSGKIQNEELFDASEHRNPVAKLITALPDGQKALRRYAEKLCDDVQQSSMSEHLVDGPLGIGQAVASRVEIDGEFSGCVFAVGFMGDGQESDHAAHVKSLVELGAKEADAQDALESHQHLVGDNQKYFKELVGLISQELVTFQTEIARRDERIHALNTQLGVRYRYHNMIGKSKPMQDLYTLLDKVKASEATVLIQGENGTGKELIAKAIHFNSPRSDRPFVTTNCSAFNDNLLESELFGHARGAFTGAIKDKKGLFEAADKGTLFLDEIGDMSVTMQVKLLRVLQEGTFTPVGSTEQKRVDVRILAATNRDLKSMVENGDFREDLYYRINVINLTVPPLRERKEDINVLIDYFLEIACQEKGVRKPKFQNRTLEKMLDYPWPGNVRELENEVERLLVLCPDDRKIGPELLSARIKEHGEQAQVQGVRVRGRLKDALEELEREMIKDGLKRTNFNKSRLAKELGISRAGLIMKVDKYGLDKRNLAKAAEQKASGE